MKQKYNVPNVVFENCNIDFSNFAGEGSKYNKAGERDFTLSINDEASATELRDQGWSMQAVTNNPQEMARLEASGWRNVKLNEYVDETKFRLKVKISFNPPSPRIAPSKITTYSGRVVTEISEEAAGMLDGMIGRFQQVDVEVRPRWWLDDATNEWNIKAYLHDMRIVLQTSKLDEKYADYADYQDE